MKMVMNKNLIILSVIVISVILISGCIGEKEVVEEPINANEEIVKEEVSEETNDTVNKDSEFEEEPINAGEKEETKEEYEETNDTGAKEGEVSGVEEESNDTEAKEVPVEDDDTSWCKEKDPDAIIEEQTINGKNVKMCCVHYDGSSLRITFSDTRCYSKDGTMELHDNIEIKNDGSGSTRTKEEKWEEGDKICKRVTDENGDLTEEGCTDRKS